ncbi:hypothetical protein [Palleronia caenipelagi]|uniref:Uncharacterized protein n=1 Tax=Palleronia caenipelagi TaxID=2489174 RepID=A0A547Q2V4_9RHOB|nr:hypothetical protein [Palleronia caenipelagi]TRD20703.1 hypothetical protein FEV53_09665 [Palleronia caenipelagi]
MNKVLEVSLFGTCAVRVCGPVPTEIRGAKHRALFAVLVTSPLGRRTRGYLQELLWGSTDYDSGHQNLRRALSDLRKKMGAAFDEVISTTTGEVEINLDRVALKGSSADGPFLADLPVRERQFQDWVGAVRASPDDITARCQMSQHPQRTRLRPRIAVLPLTPVGDCPNLNIIGDWASEEVSRMLSGSNLLTVISHLSGRVAGRTLVDMNSLRNKLDADFVLAGSIRQTGDDLSINVNFVDAKDGEVLFNRSLRCPEATVGEVLPQRLINIVRAIGRSVAETTISEARELALPRISDQKLLIAAVYSMHRRTLRDFVNARSYLEEAATRAPNRSDIWAWQAKWYVLSLFKGYSVDRERDTQLALDCSNTALDLSPESSFGLTIDGFLRSNILGELNAADQRYNAALDINPNESLAWLLRGSLMAFQSEGSAAVRATNEARQLSPIDPFGYYYDSLAATANLANGAYETALTLANRSLGINDKHISTLRAKITALHMLDRGEEARDTARILQTTFPSFTLDQYRRTHPAADIKMGRMVLDALAASGIK